MTSNTVDPRLLKILRSNITGDVFGPHDSGYNEARQAWNLAVNQRPAAVVFAQSAADVVQAVRVARSEGMRIAPQSTGHGAEPLEPLQDAILLKTSRMRQVDVDPGTRTARAEAGAQWQDVTAPASQQGLAALAGTSPNVGVTGYILGGGIGWLARRFGLAANSVTAVDIVTPDSHLVRADPNHEPDLLWAVKGGGGNVGVVTALEMTVYPVSTLYAGALFFPIERAAEVLHAWRNWTDTLPDEVTSIGRILRVPPFPEVPELLRGRAFALVEAAILGDEVAGAELIRPLRHLGPELDTFATILAPGLQQIHMDPDLPAPSHGDGMLLVDLPARGIDALLELAGPDADTALASVEIRHLGGALGRYAPGGGAQPKIDAKYLMFAAGLAPPSDTGNAVRTQLQAIKDAFVPWHADYDYYALRDTPAQADALLPPASYHHLRQLKDRYDPNQTIVSAHPVRPARC